MNFYSESIAQTIKNLKTDPEKGLSPQEVEKRQEQGKNILVSRRLSYKGTRIFLNQWKSPLILILVAAGVVSGIVGEVVDMGIILGTALLNAFIGFFQEYKANNTLEKLQSLVSYTAIVLRNGEKQRVQSEEVVTGDVVFLEAGDRVPADGRLIESRGLIVNEATLTGESAPVKKNIERLKKDIPLADRKNMVFKGTNVEDGNGRFIVSGIGKNTEFGRIASLLKDTKEEQTPLQKQLAVLAKKLSILVMVIAVGIFLVGFFLRGEDYSTLALFETAIAVAVAAIPEGLVISLTVILAIGMQFIFKRNALVRRLVAAETLGSVSVICTDKTGTLTKGVMSVVRVATASSTLHHSELALVGKNKSFQDVLYALQVGVLCNNATICEKETASNQFIGDTTEIALLSAARAADIAIEAYRTGHPRDAELPFSSKQKYMATRNGKTLFVKGAPEILITRSGHYVKDGASLPLTQDKRKELLRIATDFAAQGFRTLTLCVRSASKKTADLTDKDIDALTFVATVAIADPVRDDVHHTMALAQKAGIRVIMITGDHIQTAKAIAQEIGLPVFEKEHTMEGAALDGLTQKELQRVVRRVIVFARVSPEHKIRIVSALKKNGDIVAVTGDGVNDAPALKGADIGVAVGSGTDVAKETADIILLDDSFSTIVAAVEEGRGIYQNIKKVVLYLLSSGFSEVAMIAGSLVAGLPLAALPVQILWINVIQDSLPPMALAFDSGDKKNMEDPPRKKHAPLVDRQMKVIIVVKSILANTVLFAIFFFVYQATGDITLTRTLVFVGFAVDALFYIFSIRSLHYMIWQIHFFQNIYLIGAVAFGWCMLLLAIYWRPLQILLHTVPLESKYWFLMIGFGLFNLILVEVFKGIFHISMRHSFTRS